jgi:dinuclear metal center YbgI/SA1388 family protein
VDASLATVGKAIKARADLLIVHHGLFWSKRQPWTGKSIELLRLLIENNLAIYSSHLPLDLHPKLGNNAQLASALGFTKTNPFFFTRNQFLGVQTMSAVSRDELKKRLRSVTGADVKCIPAGPAKCRRIGIVTGGAGAEVKLAASEGVDTFITGEGPHWTFPLAEELGVNVFYGGHYATETFGVKALAAHLSAKFRVPWSFIDHPSGL